jgi:hypothetical protein
VIERVLPKDLNAEMSDHDWVEYALLDEVETITGIIAACKRRMPVNDALLDEAIVEVSPEAERDALSLASLLPPDEQQPGP